MWPSDFVWRGPVAAPEAWGAEGTPHWLVYDRDGERVRSIYGSQENAQTRLEYLLEELVAAEAGAPGSG